MKISSLRIALHIENYYSYEMCCVYNLRLLSIDRMQLVMSCIESLYALIILRCWFVINASCTCTHLVDNSIDKPIRIDLIWTFGYAYV